MQKKIYLSTLFILKNNFFIMDNTQNNDNNNSAWNQQFFLYRGVGKCLSIGISFLTNRFWKIMRLALPVVAAAALVITPILYALCDAGIENDIEGNVIFKIGAAFLIILAAAAIQAFTFRCINVNIEGLNIYSIGYKYIYNKIFWNNFLKTTVTNAVFAIIALGMGEATQLAIGLLGDEQQGQVAQWNPTSIPIWIAIAIIIYLITAPIYMTISVLCLENKGFGKDFIRGYKLGWKKIARVAELEFLILILVSILSIFIMAPAYVISLLLHSATLSQVQGDVVNIPAYLTPLTIVILFVAAIILAVITIARTIPHAYLYASVKSDETEETTAVIYDNSDN